MSTEEIKADNRGRRIWRIMLAACLIIIAAAVIKRLMKPEDPIVTVPLSSVSTEAPERTDIELETSMVGTLMPASVYYVMPKTSGEIREIYVSQGDTVNEGDPICRIDNEDQVEAARIQRDTARIAVDTAKTSLDRMSALLQTGDVSRQTYEQAKTAYDQACAQLDAAQLSYDSQSELSEVTAPVSGTVESESMELNAMAAPSSQLCVISGEGARKVQFSVPDRLLSAVEAGVPVHMERQGTDYEGTITSVDLMPNTQTGLFGVEASIEGAENIAVGSGIKVYFVSERAEDALTVPTDAVTYDGGVTYVYTVTYDGGSGEGLSEEAMISEQNRLATVHKTAVETGLSDGERTEIISGIEDDAEVIVSWTAQLYEGAQVQVLPKEG